MPFGTVSVPYTSQSADVRLESIEEQWPLYLDFAGQQAEFPQHPSLVNTDAPFVPGTACTTTSSSAVVTSQAVVADITLSSFSHMLLRSKTVIRKAQFFEK
ncbi:hypothetical protein KCU83_g159, partial [Aureobasidium melanogenum]